MTSCSLWKTAMQKALFPKWHHDGGYRQVHRPLTEGQVLCASEAIFRKHCLGENQSGHGLLKSSTNFIAKSSTISTAKTIYVTDGFCGANQKTRTSARFVTEFAWQSHFVKNMFIRPTESELAGFAPQFTVYNACSLTNKNWESTVSTPKFSLSSISKKILRSSAAPGTAAR